MPLGPPAFQFYAGDFLVSTITMSNAQVGAYIRLLCHQWVNGGVPPDLTLIAKIVHESVPTSGRLFARIRGKFDLNSDGLYKNARLEKIRLETLEFIAKQRANGAKGGRPPKNPGLSFGLTQTKPLQSSVRTYSLGSSVQTYRRKNAAAPPTTSIEPRDRPNVRVLAAMVLHDILPRGIADEGDRIDAAKRRAAQLKLKYTGRAIVAAMASAQAQRKRMNGS